MTLLFLGLAIWWIAHLFPLLAPGPRVALIDRVGTGPYKGGFALTIVVSVVLMVIGYQSFYGAQIYTPPTWGVHVNNLLMLIAVALFGAGVGRGRLKSLIRHPMLLSVVAWAAAHLLMRGDLSALMLFGGLAVWAIVSMFATNARDGAWDRPEKGTLAGDLRSLVITLVIFTVIALLHGFVFGAWPFPGGR